MERIFDERREWIQIIFILYFFINTMGKPISVLICVGIRIPRSVVEEELVSLHFSLPRLGNVSARTK